MQYRGGYFNIPEGMKLVPSADKQGILEVEDRDDHHDGKEDLTQSECLRIFKAIGLDRKKDLTGDGCVESNPGPVVFADGEVNDDPS